MRRLPAALAVLSAICAVAPMDAAANRIAVVNQTQVATFGIAPANDALRLADLSGLGSGEDVMAMDWNAHTGRLHVLVRNGAGTGRLYDSTRSPVSSPTR
jgi:hypothetical protein